MRISDIISSTRDIEISDRLCILSFVLSMKKEEILAEAEKIISPRDIDLIYHMMDKRRQGMPIAYMTNKKEFCSEEFYVDEAVLIPRPETELLVDEAIDIIKDMQAPARVIDVGTGSGAIGIIISRQTGSKVVCIDVSPEALKIARINRDVAGVSERVGLVCSDLLGGIKGKRIYDMIVANLPYISEAEWGRVMDDVKGFEPKIALYGGKDGLEIYRRLIGLLPGYIKTNGWFLCEVGGKNQAGAIKDMLTRLGFLTYIKKDYSGTERIVVGRWIGLS